MTHAISSPLTWTATIFIFKWGWNMSYASVVACSKPCFSLVPTGSSMRTEPGTIVRQEATHSSLRPSFQSGQWTRAWASRASRVGTPTVGLPHQSCSRRTRSRRDRAGLRSVGRSRLASEGWSVEPIPGGEFLDGSAAEPGQLPCGFTERKKCGDRMGVGDAEEVADLRLFVDGHRGESASVPLVSGSQQNVPDQRVDRCAADHTYPVQVLVHRGHKHQIDGDDQHDRRSPEARGAF